MQSVWADFRENPPLWGDCAGDSSESLQQFAQTRRCSNSYSQVSMLFNGADGQTRTDGQLFTKQLLGYYPPIVLLLISVAASV